MARCIFIKVFAILMLVLLPISAKAIILGGVRIGGINSPGTGGGVVDTGLKLVLPFGDSKTLGTGDQNASTGQFGYRDHLQTLLGVGTYDFVGPFSDPSSHATFDVNHAGIGGQTSGQGLARLQNTLNTYMSGTLSGDSKAIIDFGTNDCNLGVANATTVNNINSMVTTINNFNSNIDVYVILPNPTLTPALTSCIQTLNVLTQTNILNLQATIPNVHVVDEYNAFLANANWQADYMSSNGVSHPNDTGYQLEANLIYTCINNPSALYCDGH